MYAAFQWYGYTLAQLEKHQLLSRMDAKIRNMGGCDHIDAPTFGPHRPTLYRVSHHTHIGARFVYLTLARIIFRLTDSDPSVPVPQANAFYGNDCIKRSAGAYRECSETFRELIDHLRGDIGKMTEPKAQALFETTAEVISGLGTAFKHYAQKSENAWK